jgi:hypothetical protein
MRQAASIALVLSACSSAKPGGGTDAGVGGGVATPPPVAVWLRSAESTADDTVSALSAANDDSLTLVGGLTTHLTLSPGQPDQTTLDPRSTAHDDSFLADYGPNGALVSVKHPAESSTVSGSARILTDGRAVLFGAGNPSSVDPGIMVATGAAFFVAEYHSDGSLAWAKGVTGASDAASGGTLAVWPDGGVAIGGILKGTLTFGVGEPKETRLAATLTGAPSGEIYIAKLDATGSLVWERRAISAWYLPDGWRVVATPDGGLVLMGSLKGQEVLDPDLPSQLTLNSPGHGFIVKYDADGTLAWARTISQAAGQSGFAAATGLADGTVLACGSFTGIATLGSGEAHAAVLAAFGSEHSTQTQFPDLFLARYAANGTLEWAIREGGGIWDTAGQVAAFADGSVLLAGSFGNTVTFGLGSNQVTLTADQMPTSPTDFFLAHYNSDGSLRWVRRSVDTSVIAPLSDGGAAIAGSFAGTKRFFAGEPAEATLAALGASDIFIARLAAAPSGR